MSISTAPTSRALRIQGLPTLANRDWDFREAKTTYLTHGLHPYPAKFIPQIPQALIQELSRPGETVADVFCGSGTTLVEALVAGRNAVGLDANPLACLISEAKTVRLTRPDLASLVACAAQVESLALDLQADLFAKSSRRPTPSVPDAQAIRFWFDSHVIQELGEIRALLEQLPRGARLLAQAAFSSIIVAVSKQDSDTRYVRRIKRIRPGETHRRFLHALRDAVVAAQTFAETVDAGMVSHVLCADALSCPDIGKVDLVVSSPPYPNAYSYHLYHMTRMLWLGMDQPTFKRQEIGSHRKYSSKGRNCATAETFQSELRTIFQWLHRHLKPCGYACFVIGDSILKGKAVQNDEVMAEVGRGTGFVLRANFNRKLKDSKKAFNPKIGKIKDEHIVILENRGRA